MFQIHGRTSLSLLSMLLMACSHHSSRHREPAPTSSVLENARSHGLVEVKQYLPEASIDLRYATKENIAHQALYPQDMPCLLRKSTAQKLQRVQSRLRAQGYSLCFWDAWRPSEVQVKLIEKGGETGMFLDPKNRWSRHCSGVAVDVTLVDLEGHQLSMPTPHDENTDRAYYQYSGGDPEVKRHLEALQSAMDLEGFSMIPGEWWHFDDYQFFYHSPKPVTAKDLGLILPP